MVRTRTLSLLLCLTMICAAIVLSGCGGSSSSGSGLGRIAGTVSIPSDLQASGPITVAIDGADLSTQAAEDGSFTIDGVPAGVHTVVASSGQNACAVSAVISSGKETVIGDMVLGSTGQISGLITTEGTGEPIAGAQVTISTIAYENIDAQLVLPVRVAATDENGSYTVSGLLARTYLVSITKEGYNSASIELAVPNKSTATGDVALTPVSETNTGSISGTVAARITDGSLQPVSCAMIRLYPSDYPSWDFPFPRKAVDASGVAVDFGSGVFPPTLDYKEYYTFTGPDGKYEIKGIPAGEYKAVAARCGFDMDEQKVTITAGQTLTKDFTLPIHIVQSCVIEGTVLNAGTRLPIVNADVFAIYGINKPPMPSSIGRATDDMVVTPNDLIMKTKSDEQGHYRLVVPLKVDAVKAYAQGYASTQAYVNPVYNGNLTVDLALHKLNTSIQYTLSGHVTRHINIDQEVPLPGADVYARLRSSDDYETPPNIVFSAVSGSDGGYTLRLYPGEYEVYAYSIEGLSVPIIVDITKNTTVDLLADLADWGPPGPADVKK